MGIVETYYLGISTKNEIAKSPSKRETICPTHLNLPVNFLSQDEYQKKKNWFSHNVSSLSTLKILTLRNKLHTVTHLSMFLKQANRTNIFDVWLKSGAVMKC